MAYGLGIYGNHIIPREETEFDKGVSRSLDGKTSTHNTAFAETLTTDKLNKIVNKAAMSNQDRQAEAVSRADSYSWQVAHPESLRTANNTRLINHQLDTWGISAPSFPDFQRAYEACDPNLLDLDHAEVARQKDHPIKTFVGTLTKKQYDTLGEMIAAERRAAIEQVPEPTEDERTFEDLPQDQQLTLLKQGVQANQQQESLSKSVSNIDAWATLHPEFIKSERNVRLLWQQVKNNEVSEGEVTIADFEKAYQQTRGLLSLNQKSLDKQQREEWQARANEAAKQFVDGTTEAEAELLPLDEIKRRANNNFSGFGV